MKLTVLIHLSHCIFNYVLLYFICGISGCGREPKQSLSLTRIPSIPCNLACVSYLCHITAWYVGQWIYIYIYIYISCALNSDN